MSLKLGTQVALAVVLLAVLVWEIRQLVRRPSDPALRVLTIGIGLIALSVTMGIGVWPLTVADRFLDDTGGGNVLWMGMSWAFATFFLLADQDRPAEERRHKTKLSLGVFALFAVLHLAAVNLMVKDGVLYDAAFVVSAYGYALALYGIGVWRALRFPHRLQNPWVRAGVILVLVGGGAMTLGVDVITLVRNVVLYNLYPGVKYPWLSDIYNTGRVGGQIVLALGLALPAIAATVVRMRARRDRADRRHLTEQMSSLWTLLVDEFPYVVLQERSSARDFGRTTAEITDGLARLAAHLPAGAVDRPPADLVADALEARRHARASGNDPDEHVADPPYPQIEPDFGEDWRARARWMVQLGEDLESRGIAPSSEEGRRGTVITG